MWQVMKVTFWNKEHKPNDEGSIGFCDVYEDYDKALERAGDHNLVLEVAYKGEK